MNIQIVIRTFELSLKMDCFCRSEVYFGNQWGHLALPTYHNFSSFASSTAVKCSWSTLVAIQALYYHIKLLEGTTHENAGFVTFVIVLQRVPITDSCLLGHPLFKDNISTFTV